MKTRTQYLVLGVLLAVLAGVALRNYGPFSKKAPAATLAAAPAGLTPGKASVGGSGPQAGTADLPATKDVQALNEWLGTEADAAPANLAPGAPILELVPLVIPAPKAERPNAKPLPPPKLTGIIGHGPQCKAIFGDQVYAVGQQIAGTNYTITAIDGNTVKLSCGNGPEAQLDLLQ